MYKCLLFLIFPLLAFGQNREFDRIKIIGEWEKVYSRDGFDILVAEAPNSNFKAFRARGVVEGNITKYLTLYRNVEDMKGWSPKLIDKYVIKAISDTEAITYQADDIPWPAQDRDMVLRNKLYLDRKNKVLKVLTYSVKMKSHPPNKDYIRAIINWGEFSIRPINPNQTYIDFKIHAEPKGTIPAWIVNQIQRKWPYKFLKNSERAARNTVPKVKPGVMKLYVELLKLMKK